MLGLLEWVSDLKSFLVCSFVA
jgi:MFS family permease